MDWQSMAVGFGFLATGWIVQKFLIPFYVKHVDNKKIYWLVYRSVKKADEYGSSKLGKETVDAVQNTAAMTAGVAFRASLEASGLDPRVAFDAVMSFDVGQAPTLPQAEE